MTLCSKPPKSGALILAVLGFMTVLGTLASPTPCEAIALRPSFPDEYRSAYALDASRTADSTVLQTLAQLETTEAPFLPLCEALLEPLTLAAIAKSDVSSSKWIQGLYAHWVDLLRKAKTSTRETTTEDFNNLYASTGALLSTEAGMIFLTEHVREWLPLMGSDLSYAAHYQFRNATPTWELLLALRQAILPVGANDWSFVSRVMLPWALRFYETNSPLALEWGDREVLLAWESAVQNANSSYGWCFSDDTGDAKLTCGSLMDWFSELTVPWHWKTFDRLVAESRTLIAEVSWRRTLPSYVEKNFPIKSLAHSPEFTLLFEAVRVFRRPFFTFNVWKEILTSEFFHHAIYSWDPTNDLKNSVQSPRGLATPSATGRSLSFSASLSQFVALTIQDLKSFEHMYPLPGMDHLIAGLREQLLKTKICAPRAVAAEGHCQEPPFKEALLEAFDHILGIRRAPTSTEER